MSTFATRRWIAAVSGGLALLVGLAPVGLAPVGAAAAAPAAPAVDQSAAVGGTGGSGGDACIHLGTEKARGLGAVTRLGGDLDTAAARVGWKGAKLRHELLTDHDLWLDGCGHPYYVEPANPDAGSAEPASAVAAAAPQFPYTETFRLHSRPNSLRVIYLDFDGFLVEGSQWAVGYNAGASWTAPGYDTDGSPSTFSNSERETIQSIWQRVSEDYAPFDIDVTTEDPGFDAIDRSSSADTRYGTRALITKDSVVGGKCGCGGIAYVGVFDSTQAARYQPAFVFTAGVGTGAKNLAEATSHEVGHNLGLSHDGTTTGCGTGGTSACGYYSGSGAWAPIMGVGYSKPLVQFSKGEYPNANNTENDFTVIPSNGGTAMVDDRGDTTATATDLGSTLPVAITGQIDTAADVDMYKFTSAGGVTTISVSPALVSPNLDAKVTLYDATGTEVGNADPTSAYSTSDVATGLSATYTSGSLAAGTYYVGIDGVGAGVVSGSGYSDYGSVGRYALGISTTAGPAIATSSLGDASTGVAYDEVLRAVGGSGTYTWSLSAGSLPAGLTLGADGTITGTPTAAANATFTVQVSDGSQTATRAFTITAGVTITSKNLPEASQSTAYSTTLSASGGTAPYTWAIASGSLPSGLSLNTSTGAITGTPTATGTTPFTIRVTDSASRTVTRVVTITVAGALSAAGLTNTSLKIGTSVDLGISASGGRPGYIWTLVSGSFLSGLQFNDVGSVTGTPLTSGTSTATVRATDRSGRTATATVTLTASGFTFSPSSLPAARQGVPYSQDLSVTYTGITAPLTWTVASGALPAGLTLSSSGTISGTPTVNGSFSVTVRATDANGWNDTKAYPLTVNPPTTPGAPTIGTATAGNAQASVSWTAPSTDGGSAITGYVVTPYIGATAQTAQPFTSTDTTQTVTGLTNGTAYTFKVAATNGVGTGTQSAASNSVTPQADKPGAPTDVAATRKGSGAAQVTWSTPASDGGAPITAYKITPYIAAAAQDATIWPVSANVQTVSGLTNGSTYTFVVNAINAAGTGPDSDPSAPVTVATTPDQPVIVSATAGDEQVDLSWSAPVIDGGMPVTGYVITPYVGSSAETPVTVDGTDTSHTVTGLLNGVTYTFTVKAVNEVGVGAASPASEPVTPQPPPTVPDAPTIGTATGGNAQATVTWTAPSSDGRSAITGYVVTPYIGATAQTPVPFSSTATTQTVTGLTNGTTYTFTVAAVNAVGTGADSAASNAVTPSAVTVPGAPTVTSALPGNGQVALAWSAPASNGGSSITGYVITPYITGAAQAPINVTGTTKTVTGLANGTTYTFKVAAKNVVGTGAQSAESTAVTAGTPSAPGFQSAAPGNASAKVAWTAPANNGAAITGYVITPYVGLVAGTPQTFTTTATSDVVTGLANGTEYTFKVAAINANGTGAQSTTAPITVGTPTQPVFPRVVPGTTSAQVIWNASTPNGGPIQGYIVTPYLGSTALTPVNFHSTATAQTITGLTTGSTYTFRIVGYNAFGNGPSAATPSVIVGSPAQPGFQTAGPGNGTASVRYLIGAANAAPIQSFTVWPVQGSTVLAPQTFTTPTATLLTVTGLTNGVSYTFRIAATNSIGTGPYATTNATTVGTPVQPAFPSAQPGDGTAKVAWSIAADNGSAITGYRVTPYVGSSAQPTQSFSTTANNVTVTGLTNGTTYTFKVAAVNAMGTGPENVTTAIKVGTPTTVSWPSAAPLDASAKVSWQAASSPASPLTGYVVTPVQGTTVLAPQTFNSTATTQTVTGLTNGVTYTFRIAAINSWGTGVYQTTAAVKVGLPSAPTAITVTAGAGQVTVSWTAPSGNGNAITNYVITPYIGSTAQSPQTFDATTTSRIITGLTPGTAYTFKVAAVNSIGTGAQSSASKSVTPT